jgi:putative thiamine transport system ATP-binding protein
MTSSDRGLRLEQVRLMRAGCPPVQVDLAVAPGEIGTVMGPSGAGKSTLLAFIGGFLDPGVQALGRVTLQGRDLAGMPARERRIGLLFQDDLLFPHLSVGQNLAFGLPAAIRGRAARLAAVEAALAEVGLRGMADRDPATLSGGERQRVALQRALLAEPRALLLDEPFSRLDAKTRTHVRALVFERLRQLAIPALLVTHDPDDARAAAGPIVTLSL